MLRFSWKALCLAMTIVLIVGLCPGLAFANHSDDELQQLIAGLFEKEKTINATTTQDSEADDTEIVSISAGTQMSAAVRADGSVWTWGCGNMSGDDAAWGNHSYWDYTNQCLGLAAGTFVESNPTMVASSSAQSIACSMHESMYVSSTSIGDHAYSVKHPGPITAVLKNDGSLWMWSGNGNLEGVLGTGSEEQAVGPVKVLENVVSYDTSGRHSAAVTSDGSLYMWGSNTEGQLGIETTDPAWLPSPTKISLSNVKEVSLGEFHSAALRADGSVWMWGANEKGQVGNNSTDDVLGPTRVFENAKTISLGSDYSAAVKNDGTLWVWGNNSDGQLGLGNKTEQHAPVCNGAIENVSVIEMGDRHSAAIDSNGVLWMWGANEYGQIGDGSRTSKSRPQVIDGEGDIESVRDVALGQYHTLVLSADGTLWSWGYNSAGQLGDHTTENKIYPVKINLGRIIAGFSGDGIEKKTLDIPWDESNLYKYAGEYRQDFAIGGLVLSEAAYGSFSGVLSQFGYKYIDDRYNSADPSYYVGYKVLYDFDTPHVQIVMGIRGTVTDDDFLTNIKSVTDNFDSAGMSCLNGLLSAEEKISSALQRAGLDVSLTKTNTKYFLTGHSLGGACAGKVGLRLYKKGLGTLSNIFAYTFASPTYSTDITEKGAVPGIHDIFYFWDKIVPNVPRFMYNGAITIPAFHPGKPHCYIAEPQSLFQNALINLYGYLPDDRYYSGPDTWRAHMTPSYLAALLTQTDQREVSKVFSRARLISVHCPVNVEVYGLDGVLFGKTDNGVAQNLNNSAVRIVVIDDAKFIELPFDGQYTIKYIGTDAGTMKVEDQIFDTETGEAVSEEVFQNVVLEKGKTFTSLVDGSAETVNTELYVLDGNSKPIAVVQNDGTETPVSSPGAETTGGGDSASGIADGETSVVGGATYGVVSNTASTAVFKKAPKAKKSVTVPAAVTIVGKSYKVVGIAKNAFKGTKAKKVTIKTPLLTKSSVKGCFKGAKKLKTVKVPKAKKKAYKKIFAKKVCGKKVKVK